MRHLVSAMLLVALGLAVITPSIAAAQDATSSTSPAAIEKNLAPRDVADAATEFLTTWVKRAGSKNPDVRHRAWTSLTPEAQETLFFGEEQYMATITGEVLQFGDVTVEDAGVGIEAVVSGLWTPHGLYHVQFILAPVDDSYQLANYDQAPGIVVPEGMTHISLNVSLRDDSIKVSKSEIQQKDVLAMTVTNKGTVFHSVVIYRVADGQTADELVAQISNRSADDADKFVLVGAAPEGKKEIALINVEPGTYVIAGYNSNSATPDTLIGVSTVLTVTE